MFIAVGPPSFTGLVLVGLAKALPEDYGYFASRPLAIEIVRTMADFIAIFLWVLALFWFFIALISVLMGARKMGFHLVWWACVFPNTGFTISTITIGRQLESEGILWVGSAMTILLVVAWMFIFVAQVRAVVRREILMPGRDEDKGELLGLEMKWFGSLRCAECFTDDDKKHGIRCPSSSSPQAAP